MGIPSYFSHIVRCHRKIIKEYKKENEKKKIDNLYLDCNSLIYESVNELNNKNKDIDKKINDNVIENKIIYLVCEKIVNLIKLLKPTQKVFIAFDGVAPVAKLNQQRNRRYKSWFTESFIQENELNVKENKNKWDTIAITPGTKFMKNLSLRINNYFNVDIKKNKNFKLNNIEIIVSSSDVVGEGEHKIFEFIRNNKEYHKLTTSVIYGLDADLIMLTLNHLHIAPNMYLFRETPHFIKSLDNTLNPNNNYLLDIPLFSSILTHKLNTDKKPSTNQEKMKIYDYIVLCFLLGNDFLPHFPSLNIRTNGIERVLNAYTCEIGCKNQNLIKNDEIVWKCFRNLLINLSKDELDFIKDEYKIRSNWKKTLKNKSKTIEESLMMVPLKDTCVEDYINPYCDGWEARYYKELLDVDIEDEETIKKICINYFEGIEWTFKYYSTGCIDWRWKYNYDYPPLLSHLSKYVPYFNTTFIKPVDKNPVSQLLQLAYVLPRNKLNILPEHIFETLLKKYSKLYRSDYEFKWCYCRYFWECHVVMPNIDIRLLENICN
tara:strand:+ start:8308 stop:9945 length:1638 start_codon:yes stop_codon:yes gene_type:complete